MSYYHKSVIVKSSSSRSIMSSIRLLKKKFRTNPFIHSNQNSFNNSSFITNINASFLMPNVNSLPQAILLRERENKSSLVKPYIPKDKPFYETLFRFPKAKTGSYNNLCNLPKKQPFQSINESLIAENKINSIITKLGLIKKVYDHVYPITLAKGMRERKMKINKTIKRTVYYEPPQRNSIFLMPDHKKMRLTDLGSKYPKKNTLNETSWGTFYQHKPTIKVIF